MFAVAVAATLAAGIAVATTAYGVARAVLWRPLPFADASRLVFVWEAVDSDGQLRAARVTGARYAAWREVAGDVGGLALFGATGFSVESPAGSSTVRGVRVSVNYFDTLGIGASLGRTFAPHDGQALDAILGRRAPCHNHRDWRLRAGGAVPGRLGMYGLLTVLVGSRRREIGVRLAIGASPWWIARRIIADGLRTASLGVLLGAALSIATSRLMEHLLVDVSRNDVPTLGISLAVLLAVATIATLHPALRASRIDPATILRGE